MHCHVRKTPWPTIVVVLLLLPALASGQITSYEILVSAPTDARTLGMGESALTNGSGPLVALSNPALLGLDNTLTVAGTPPAEWPFDDNTVQDYAVVVPLPTVAGRKASLAFGYRRFDVETIVRTAFEPEGPGIRIEILSEAWSAACGVPILPWLSAGASIRSAEFAESGDHLNSFDLHLLAQRHFEIPGSRALQTRFAVAARNVGDKPSVYARENPNGIQAFEKIGVLTGPLPAEWAVGMGADLHWGPTRISAAMDLADPVYRGATDRWRQHYGVECLFFAVAAVRGGFLNEEHFEDFTFGAGLRIPVIHRVYVSADYARRPNPYQDLELGDFEPTNFYTFGVSYDLP